MGNWQAEPGVPLQKKPDGTWVGTVELMNGVSYAFKVNRGTWSTVRARRGDEEVPNHDFVAENAKPVQVTVDAWSITANPRRATDEQRRNHRAQQVSFEASPCRATVVVYLPPDYDTSEDRRYPVLYMQDGQNLFNEATSFNGIDGKWMRRPSA
jgi:pullulanase